MGWFLSMMMLLAGLIGQNDVMIFTSGLFAIAGAITSLAIDKHK